MRITIDITRQDVANAVKAQLADSKCSFTGCCPIAQALKRNFPDKLIFVGSASVTVGNKEYYAVKASASDMKLITSLGKKDWPSCKLTSLEFALRAEILHENHS